MNRYIAAYVVLVVAAAIVAAYAFAHPINGRADLATIAAAAACLIGSMIALHRMDMRATIAAWTSRASFVQIMVDCAIEYQAHKAQSTARASRSHTRAYINVRYAYLTRTERAIVLRYALEYAAQHLVDMNLSPLRDINARPSYA